jgi:hypothetical protein
MISWSDRERYKAMSRRKPGVFTLARLLAMMSSLLASITMAEAAEYRPRIIQHPPTSLLVASPNIIVRDVVKV